MFHFVHTTNAVFEKGSQKKDFLLMLAKHSEEYKRLYSSESSLCNRKLLHKERATVFFEFLLLSFGVQ